MRILSYIEFLVFWDSMELFEFRDSNIIANSKINVVKNKEINYETNY